MGSPASQKNTPTTSAPSSSSSIPQHDEQSPPSELINIGVTLVSALIAARLLSAASRLAAVIAAPLAALYLMSTCPCNDSFDAKRELKRVLRGDNLPENHPQKPKGFLGNAIAKVSAAIEAEAAALSGSKVEIIDLFGLVKVASIRTTTSSKDYYWLGAVSKWRFLIVRDVPQPMKKD